MATGAPSELYPSARQAVQMRSSDWVATVKRDDIQELLKDGTPKRVPLHKGPKDGLYYFNEAGNKVYGTPAARHVEMIEETAAE